MQPTTTSAAAGSCVSQRLHDNSSNNTWRYVGQRDPLNDLRHGLGSYDQAGDSDVDVSAQFVGEWRHGLPHGYGCLLLRRSSCCFLGEMRRGRPNGYGQLISLKQQQQLQEQHNQLAFVGQFVDGVPNGEGTVIFTDGTCGLPRYEGRFDRLRLVQRYRCDLIVIRATRAAVKARQVADAAAAAAAAAAEVPSFELPNVVPCDR